MKYFFLRYTDNIPEKFDGECKGPFIKIRPKSAGDKGLLEHEKVHVRQWYVLSALALLGALLATYYVNTHVLAFIGLVPFVQPLAYKYFRPFRKWSEVQAYRKQLDVGGYPNNDFAVNALVKNYDVNLDAHEAAELLVG